MEFGKSTNRFSVILISCGLASLAFTGPAKAFDEAAEIKLGEAEYLGQCAACHGPAGRGDGPVAAVLQAKPPDLTQITARYSGAFPTEHIYAMIDGRNMINPHGDRNMPVWGDRYFDTAVDKAMSVPHDLDTQALVHGRITALIAYLESIQAN